MTRDDYKEVTHEEFEAFVAAYPRKLVRDVFAAYEPPLVTLNDLTLGDWPECVVAHHRVPATGFNVLKETAT